MSAGVLVIKTKLDKKGFEDGVNDLKREGNGGNIFTKLFQKAENSGKGLSKTIGTISKDVIKVVGTFGLVSIALAGLIIGAGVLYRAFKKAWDQNKQAQADFKYFGFAINEAFDKLAETLTGKISNGLTGLTNLIYKLLQYINYISVAWFKVNLFENASAKNFKKVNSEANKYKKTMAGFDEMNVLSSDKGGGTGDNVGAPSFDLSEVPSDEDMEGTWIGWIAKNKELVIGALAGIALGLLAIKLLDPTTWIVLAIVALGALVGVIIKNWDTIKETLKTIGDWIYNNIIAPIRDHFVGLWEKISTGATGIWEGIKKVFSTVADFFSTTFTRAWEGVKKVFSTGGKIFTGIKDGIVTAFKTIVNKIIDGINRVVSVPFNAINTLLQKIKDASILGVKPFGFVTTIKVPQIPKLARGGIINAPGKGVPLGIGGEAGPEGVIPFTNEQQMDLIGRAIAKYLTIDLTNITTLDGRTIARSIKKIQGQNDFAMNR